MSKKASKSTKQKIVSLLTVDNIKQIDSTDNLGNNQLSFRISGQDVNYKFSNTILRTIINLVGSYGFNGENVEFQSNTSIFNRDVLRFRLNNTPILYKDYQYPPIDNFAEKCVELELDRKDIAYIAKKDEIEEIELQNKKKMELLNNLHMHVTAKNTTNDIMHVDTSSEFTTFYLDSVVIPNIYPKDLLLVELNPGQEINFTAIADFNIPANGDMYSSAIVARHVMINENSYIIILESLRQIPEKVIVQKACEIIIIKFNNMRDVLLEHINSLRSTTNIEYSAHIEIKHENHTLGEIFTYHIQNHPNITFAGFNNEHPDINDIFFEYSTEGMPFSKILVDVIKEITDLYQNLADQLLAN
jgi:DNA-directed RNA polymerase subunit L